MSYKHIQVERVDNGYIVRYPLFIGQGINFTWKDKAVVCVDVDEVKIALNEAIENIEKIFNS